jgi:hypothetical protein
MSRLRLRQVSINIYILVWNISGIIRTEGNQGHEDELTYGAMSTINPTKTGPSLKPVLRQRLTDRATTPLTNLKAGDKTKVQRRSELVVGSLKRLIPGEGLVQFTF